MTYGLRKVLSLLAMLALPLALAANVPSKTYTFVANTPAQSAQVNSDFDTLYTWANGNVDHTNVSSATGIYASQIIPDASATASFGGGNSAYGYVFSLATAGATPLTVLGYTGQTADLLDVFSTGRTTKYAWVDSGGVLHTNAGPSFGGPMLIGAASIPATSGTQVLIGADGSGYANYLASGNAHVFRSGAGTTYATINASGLTMSVGSLTLSPLTTAGVLTNTAAGVVGTSAAPAISGANITAATVPNAALVTPAVTSVTAGSTKVSIGGTATAPTVDVVPGNFAAGSVPQAALAAFAGVNVGGALSNATTGAFSGSITAQSLNATGNIAGTASGPSYGGTTLGAYVTMPTGGGSFYVTNYNGGTTYGQIGTSGFVAGSSTFGGTTFSFDGGVFTSDTSGNVTAASYNVSASRPEWKTHIATIPDALGMLRKMPSLEWCYNDKGPVHEACAPGEHRHYGPMSRPMDGIVATRAMADDPKHGVRKGEVVGINETNLLGLNVAAVQQLADKVDRLQKRLAHLERRR